MLLSLGRNLSVVVKQNRSWAPYMGTHVTLDDRLNHGKIKYTNLFNKPSVDMTALHYAIQSENELKIMRNCGFDINIQDQLLFPIPRRSLQMTCALATLLIKTPAKNDEFAKFVHDLHEKHVLPIMPDMDIKRKREQCSDSIKKILADIASKEQNPSISQQFDRFMAKGNFQRERGLVTLTEAELKELVIKLIADNQVKIEIDRALHGLIESKFESLIDSGALQPLHLVEPVEAQSIYEVESKEMIYPGRVSTLFAGGPGSGKSTSATSVALVLKDSLKLDLEDMANINIDRIRMIYYFDQCVNEADKKDIGTFTHAEAVIVFNMIRDFMHLRISQNKKVPHCIQEMVGIWPEWIDLALNRDGSMLITISTRDTANAVNGTIDRGIDQKERVTPPELVLSSYQSVSHRFPDVIQETQGKKVVITLMNNEKVLQSKFRKSPHCEEVDEHPKPVAIVDCENNTIYILDIKLYLDFLNQSQINTKAVEPKEIYAGADLSIESSIARAIDPKRFGFTKIALVRQDIDSTAISNLEKNIVLTVQDEHLDIIDSTYYDALKQVGSEYVDALEARATSHIRSFSR